MMSVKNGKKSSTKSGENSPSHADNTRNREDEGGNQGIDKTYILPDPTKLTCMGKI